MITVDNENLQNVFQFVRANELDDFFDWLLEDEDTMKSVMEQLEARGDTADLVTAYITHLITEDLLRSDDLAMVACAAHGHIYADVTRLWFDSRGQPYPVLSNGFVARAEAHNDGEKTRAP